MTAAGPGRLVILAAVAAAGFLFLLAVALIVVIVGRIVRWARQRDARRVLAEVRAHLDHFASTDPEVAASLARLHDAVGDEQTGGKSA